ncbi:precorrin-6A/cobalt-precorrin-6A reductase [Thalassobaculum sp. OXR-137]|uniref:precorrin-6A/cobalt-precorrin-6A reductase n=1 Tax=Thalassobaculum sp. OXR-137 TaxID=3100173 RepID=UPI002AC94EA7|nr:precorrin-6A/cobalt-precorrin-6A reductase [Thalassobaculum sp. OXR-137]WPZ35238.1 precorrin-6A/cobalt-precorrin-6A reductase [Thalassobaculum sp. OXR-137]
MSDPNTLRIFVGTAEGTRLAERLAEHFGPQATLRVTLHGGARPPRGCLVDRIGDTEIGEAAAVIDALDPFARRTVRAVRDATRRASIPRLSFRPRGWERHPLDRWVEVRDLQGAVGAIASVARTALLWLPPRDVAAFAPVGGLRFPTRLVRMPVGWSLPPRFEPILAAPPYSLAGDTLLLRRTEAQAVVMRATGAETDAPLVRAARSLDLPIVMIRPPLERGEVPARSVDVTLDWVDSILNPPDYLRTAREWR